MCSFTYNRKLPNNGSAPPPGWNKIVVSDFREFSQSGNSSMPTYFCSQTKNCLKFFIILIPQSHLLYGGRTVAVELQNRVIPAVAVEILRWPQDRRTANPYVLQAAGVAVEL